MDRRPTAVAEVESRLLGRMFPRLMMCLLVTISGGAAFLVAFGLLHAGVVSMAVRYGVAAVVGYVLLLCMFRLWLWAAVRRTRWAAAAVIVIAIAAGYLIQRFAPEALSIGDLWR